MDEFLQGLTDEQFRGVENSDYSKLTDEQFAKLEALQREPDPFANPKGYFEKSIPTYATSIARSVPFAESLGKKAAGMIGEKQSFEDFLKKHDKDSEEYPWASGLGTTTGIAAQMAAGEKFSPGMRYIGKGADLITKYAPHGIKTIGAAGARTAGVAGLNAADAYLGDKDAGEAFDSGAIWQGGLEALGIGGKLLRAAGRGVAKSAIDAPDEMIHAYGTNPKPIDEAPNFTKQANDLLTEPKKLTEKIVSGSQHARKYLTDVPIPAGKLRQTRNKILSDINKSNMPVDAKEQARKSVHEAYAEVEARLDGGTALSQDQVKDIVMALDTKSKYAQPENVRKDVANEYRKAFRGELNKHLRAPGGKENEAYSRFMDENVSPAAEAREGVNRIIVPAGKNKDTLTSRLESYGAKGPAKVSTDKAIKKLDEVMGTKYAEDAKNAYYNKYLSNPVSAPGMGLSNTSLVRSAMLAALGGDKKQAIKILYSRPSVYTSRLIDALGRSGATGLALAHQSLMDKDPNYVDMDMGVDQ